MLSTAAVSVSIEQRQQGRVQYGVCVTVSWTSYPGEARARGGLLAVSVSLDLTGAVCQGSMLGLLQ